MTERVVDWIRGWAGADMQVQAECMQMAPGMMAVYRRGIVARQEYPDGSREETHRFALEICLAAQTEAGRAENMKRIEEMEAWILEQDIAGSLPEKEGMVCWRAEIVSGFEMKKSGAMESVYRAEMDLYCMVG